MRALPLLGLVALALAAGCVAARVRGPAARPTAPERTLTLMFMADAHGDLESHPELFWRPDGSTEVAEAGGYARLAGAANAIRRETGGRALLIDGGDTFQGSAVAAWSRGEAVVAPHRALGVDVGVPGNWEVVYGPDRMRQLTAALGYPVVAANVLDEASGRPVFPPYVVREAGGVRVGFVGFTDPDVPRRQSPSYSRGLRYLGPESVAPHVRALRERERADLVVLVTHVGLARSVALADSLRGVDVILSGDSHERVYEPIERNGVLVVEPGSFAAFLGRLDVRVRPGARPTFTWRLLELRADRYPEDPAMRAVVDAAVAPYRERLDRVLGRAAVPLERYGVVENSADDVLTSALRAATGVDVALSNGFRFAHPIPAGPVTEADLWRLYPVVTRVKVGAVTGRQLREFWESEIDHVFADDPRRLFGGWLPRVAGMTVRFRASAPAGRRVTAITVGGAALDDARTYTLAACEREGDTEDALCRIRGVASPRVLDVSVHDVVRAWLARQPTVGGPPERRVVAEDLPPRVFSQYYRR